MTSENAIWLQEKHHVKHRSVQFSSWGLNKAQGFMARSFCKNALAILKSSLSIYLYYKVIESLKHENDFP